MQADPSVSPLSGDGERPWEVTPAECHLPTPTMIDLHSCKIVCSCEWETAVWGVMRHAWEDYRGHWHRAVDSEELPAPLPRKPKNAPLQSERLFIP